MIPPDVSPPIKPGAEVDPKVTALVKKMRELKAQSEIGEKHSGRIRILPKTMPEHNTCACGCSCCG